MPREKKKDSLWQETLRKTRVEQEAAALRAAAQGGNTARREKLLARPRPEPKKSALGSADLLASLDEILAAQPAKKPKAPPATSAAYRSALALHTAYAATAAGADPLAALMKHAATLDAPQPAQPRR